MENSNKDILLKANEAVAAGNYVGFLQHCTDDMEWTFVGEDILRGKESILKYMNDAYIEPPKLKVEKLIAEEDYVTAIGTINMINETGKWTEYRYCDVWRFNHGKMAELTAFVIEEKR